LSDGPGKDFPLLLTLFFVCFEKVIVGFEGRQTAQLNIEALEAAAQNMSVLKERDAFPGGSYTLPFVLHDNRLHSLESCEGTLLEANQVITVGLCAFRIN
jgi:hypothetical protein